MPVTVITGIYKITCLANGKIYIGSSLNANYRLTQHRGDLKRGDHDNPKLQNAYNKYGFEAFTWEIVEEMPGATSEELYKRELEWFHETNCCDRQVGFNIADVPNGGPGLRGENHPMYGKRGELSHNFGSKRSEESKRIMKEAQIKLGKERSQEWRDNRSRVMKNQPPRSEEYRKNLSEGRKKYLATKPNMKQTEDVKLAKSLTHPKRKITPEQYLEVAELIKGGVSDRDIGEKYGLEAKFIKSIRTGKTYKNEYKKVFGSD